MAKSNKIFLIIVTLIAVGILAFGNPYDKNWLLKCPLHALTGLQCPFCGTQRAIHELAHGNLAASWQRNQGLLLASPYLLLLTLGSLFDNIRKSKVYECCSNQKSLCIFVLLMAIWGIVRNFIF